MNRPAHPIVVDQTVSPALRSAASFPVRIARVPGEAFDADQIGWSCDECGRDEYACGCEVETCDKCQRTVDSYGYCGCPATGWALAEKSAWGMGAKE